MSSTILVTGGTGYIGSHTVVELVAAGHDVVIVDNLCNSSAAVLPRLEALCGRALPLIEADLRDRAALEAVFADHQIDAIIHFAGLKAVGESVANPLLYHQNNVGGMLTLLDVAQASACRQFVFSSSATVYGTPKTVPITESFPLQVTNPYGRTKLIGEQILDDLRTADPSWRIAVLRYFNPVGAHASGTIGEAPNGVPNNLMPYLTQVAAGKRDHLSVFGTDWPTIDGTGVRDYIHVVDLACGHLAALDALQRTPALTVNLGTGRGASVRQLVAAFEATTGIRIPCVDAPRRAGDVAACYADPTLAASLLGWRAQYTLEQMCADAWRWQSANPNGYAD